MSQIWGKEGARINFWFVGINGEDTNLSKCIHKKIYYRIIIMTEIMLVIIIE